MNKQTQAMLERKQANYEQTLTINPRVHDTRGNKIARGVFGKVIKSLSTWEWQLGGEIPV